MIRKLLIANRGEIAVRIIRTCRAMGIVTVVAYAEPDRDSLAVELADEAVALGGATPSESYLVIEKIVNAALKTGADAVHPGFGFLAENAQLAYQLAANGLTFVGPSPSSIEAMGDKRIAKTMLKDVPFVPSYYGDDQADETFTHEAARIGYPIMVKAAAGGGGRGMRLVQQPADLLEALASARREAAQAFGSDSLMLERALLTPRHIEVQIIGDQHGHVIALGERECSVQRRHQKIIEEAPSTALTPDLRQRICDTAVSIGQQIGYYNAGTVEFLLDTDGQFYFMEMNTRLQVEHPVTEMIYGVDLVRWQIRIAEGARLSDFMGDAPPQPRGHAVEVRVYAEDPSSQFLPVTGPIHHFQASPHARTDSGVRSGDVVSPYYDPMIAKVIAHADTRAEALRALHYALGETQLIGITNNIAYLRRVLLHPDHVAGKLSTRFVDDHADLLPEPTAIPAAALVAAALSRANVSQRWRNFHNRPAVQRFMSGDTPFTVALESTPSGQWQATVGDAVHLLALHPDDDQHRTFTLDGHRRRAAVFNVGDQVWVHLDGTTYALRWVNPLPITATRREAAGSLRAPMPGKIIRVAVEQGQAVAAGDLLMILEAMKMEHRIEAPYDGVVSVLCYQEGETVSADEILLELAQSAAKT
ncbi:biotin carboxylase N-terminal domain-containing protein [Aggregatilineales bacterium SYSU G02658]